MSNGPASMLSAQLPAGSQTLPEGMITADPGVPVLLVKSHEPPGAAWQGSSGLHTSCRELTSTAQLSPAVASEAVKPALWRPLQEPSVAGSEQLSALGLRTSVGATVSMRIT